jgi:ketosteroid isomerase-like protein
MDTAQKHAIILCRIVSFRTFFLRTMMLAVTTAMIAGVASAHEPDAQEIALGSLVDAELAFARLALEQGIRAAFLANFAADGVVFEPAPVRIHAAWTKRPAPADPKAVRLEWEPAQAGVARSDDMGFSTGPYKLSDTRRADSIRHGVFFSIWQRDARGVWRVGIDLGATTPHAMDFVALGAAPRPSYAGKANVAAQRAALFALERRHTDERDYKDLLAPDARLYRDGAMPIAGRDAVAQDVQARASQIEWIPFEVRISRAGDMAASYGKVHARGGTGGDHDGYYVHLWLRDVTGRWRLAYDIENR